MERLEDITEMLGVPPETREVHCLGKRFEILPPGKGVLQGLARVNAGWGRPNPVFALPHWGDPEIALGRYLLGWGKRQHTPAAARAALEAARAEIKAGQRPRKCQGVAEC